MSKSEAFTGVMFIIMIIIVGGLIVGFENVSPGYEGVVTDRSANEVQQVPLGIGWHLVNPISKSVTDIEVREQIYEAPAAASSKDMQDVTTIIAVNYHPTKGETPQLFENIGLDYRTRKIEPAVQETLKAVVAQYTAEELITKRAEVSTKIKLMLQQKLSPSHITVEDISIVNFKFSEEYANAIEEKQIAEQRVKTAENDLRRIEIEADQQVAMAIAEAEAIRITGEALSENPALVQLEWVKKWDGKVPLYQMGGDASILVQTPQI